MKQLESNGNAVFSLNYHIIVCVKYRKKAFVKDEISEFCKECIRSVSPKQGVDILEIECGEEHVHILCRTKPSTDIPKYLNILKGYSSRMLRKEFPELQKILYGDAFWSPSYYIATAGNVSLDTLMRYVENQRNSEEE